MSTMPTERTRKGASLATQSSALLRKNIILQRRSWLTNVCLVFMPMLFCVLLFVMQQLVNEELDTRDFRCGCKCLKCCDWVVNNATGQYEQQCYEATNDRPCNPYAECLLHDDTQCGFEYSTYSQAGFCEVKEPPVWPALLQVPLEKYRNPKLESDASFLSNSVNASANGKPVRTLARGSNETYPVTMFYRGENRTLAERLTKGTLTRVTPLVNQLLQSLPQTPGGGGLQALTALSSINLCSSNTSLAQLMQSLAGPGAANIDVNSTNMTQMASVASLLTEFLSNYSIVLGTSAATSVTNYIEPAFVADAGFSSATRNSVGMGTVQYKPSTDVRPLYYMSDNCTALGTLDRQLIGNLSCALERQIRIPMECTTVVPMWMPDRRAQDTNVFCGWRESGCQVINGTEQPAKIISSQADQALQEYPSMLYDWEDTNKEGLRLTVAVNNSHDWAANGMAPTNQRWSKPLEMAANSYLRYLMNDTSYSISLVGFKGFPYPGGELRIDLASLLGPLFFMWLMQLLLPVYVAQLVSEKEGQLRSMMTMQGLGTPAYYIVNYVWQMLLYIVFMAIFWGFGAAIGLLIFTKNSIAIQAIFYLLWGHMMVMWGFAMASLSDRTQPAVLTAILVNIFSGLVANLVMVQFVENGPNWLALVLQLLPSFALFRGLWELAQYAFLADINKGKGMTWSNLSDDGNGMVLVWIILLVESFWVLFVAWYFEQIYGIGGTSIRRHPFFPTGFMYVEDPKTGKIRTGHRLFHNRAHKALSKGPKTGSKPLAFAAAPAGEILPMVHKEERPVLDNGSESGSDLNMMPLSGGFPLAPIAEILPTSEEGMTPASSNGRRTLTEASGVSQHTHVRSAPSNGSQGPLISDDPTDALWRPVASKTSTHLHVKDDLATDEVDVCAERMRVDRIWEVMKLKEEEVAADMKSPHPGWQEGTALLVRNLRKVYPGKDGQPDKVAVAQLSLAVYSRECFGLLGPNGAGKTTSLKMMQGFLQPTSGTVMVQGYDVRSQTSLVHHVVGVCPQHDLLWKTLTAREHLTFYGTLKNLKGDALLNAVEESLQGVNLHEKGVADKVAGSYSGGMKRRLSVAISTMGDPAVVFLDEPSTGLDPASRRLLWDVIRRTRQERAVMLTTHSMEEAEALCDRMGIFVLGGLRCIGSPKELTARYGSHLFFTLTTPLDEEQAAADVVYSLCPGAQLVYSIGGTQKFEMPKEQVTLHRVFSEMDRVKRVGQLRLLDWGICNATLEQVFIKVTQDAGAHMTTFV